MRGRGTEWQYVKFGKFGRPMDKSACEDQVWIRPMSPIHPGNNSEFVAWAQRTGEADWPLDRPRMDLEKEEILALASTAKWIGAILRNGMLRELTGKCLYLKEIYDGKSYDRWWPSGVLRKSALTRKKGYSSEQEVVNKECVLMAVLPIHTCISLQAAIQCSAFEAVHPRPAKRAR